MNQAPVTSLDALREKARHWASPVIVFNKSHSGSRMLAELLSSAGIFMGAHVNASWDSLDLLELITRLVRDYYPDYTPLWQGVAGNPEIAALAERVFARHLNGVNPASGARWGWKLCETVYAVPVLDYCFPEARYIHLIRDGRDVAFCDHRAPDDAFWRKVYFNTDRIRTYAGLRLTPQAYRRRSHIFNAIHWVNSVTIGRHFGMMLRERYLEVRYEALCADFEATARRVLAFAGVGHPDQALHAIQHKIYRTSVAKHRTRSARDQRQVMAIIKPLLLSLGYLDADHETPPQSLWHSARMDNLIDGVRKRRNRKMAARRGTP